MLLKKYPISCLILASITPIVFFSGCSTNQTQPIAQTETLSVPQDHQPNNIQPRVNKASLSLSTAQTDPTINQKFKVDIILDSHNLSVDGTDIILKYDPRKLQVVNNMAETRVEPGNIFNEFIAVKVDNQLGRLNFSALSKPGQNFIGSGLLATVYFKNIIASGTADILFDFTIDKTSDTNVASNGQDILGSVDGLHLTVKDTF